MADADQTPRVLASDIRLLVALDDCDGRAIAQALDEGCGTAGSESLRYLLHALKRDCQRELVRRLPRGRPSASPEAFHVAEEWFGAGISPEVRRAVADGLRAGSLVVRRRRTPGARGRPSGAFPPGFDDGVDIHRDARRRAIESAPSEELSYKLGLKAVPEAFVREAIQDWTPRTRSGNVPAITTEKQVDTRDRRARRAKLAYSDFRAITRKMDK